ncbi:MAG: polysaccharide deacetylase family protein [Bacteroidales bacterium]|nr:polysaccharide deacetylase family protein [Bacteroidales bacterium]
MSFIFYVLIIALYVLLLSYGSYFINSNFYIRTICSKKNNNKEIAITFDDGPVKEITPLILDVLKEFNIKAAFFCIGNRIINNESILKQIDEEGHIIGNHSYSHSCYFDFFSSKKMTEELIKTEDIIYQTIGKKVRFFRPPYGVTNPALKKAVNKMKYTVIGWSLRSLDTKGKDHRKILSRVKKRLKPGDIILFHDINPEIINVLREFIEYALSNNYKIVRFDKLINNVSD